MATKAPPVAMKMKLRKGDRVEVLSGKSRGETGEITKVLPKSNRVVIGGVNMAKKHQRATSAKNTRAGTIPGGIIDKDMPLHASAVAIVCPKDGATRIGYRIEGGTKVRVCRKCGDQL
jgi:large subunit ribosomal protein L24